MQSPGKGHPTTGRCRACHIFHQHGIFSNAFDLIPWNDQIWLPAKQAEKAWSAENDKGTQIISKKYLFEMIWHLDALGELATVTVHVNRLRDKLNEVQPEFTAIETVWGNGYRFRVEE